MCNKCKNEEELHLKEHKSSFKSIDKFVSLISADIENHSRCNKALLKEIY